MAESLGVPMPAGMVEHIYFHAYRNQALRVLDGELPADSWADDPLFQRILARERKEREAISGG